MKITRTTEVRTVSNIAYIEVKNLAAVGSDLLMTGKGRVKVVQLAKGGYSVRPVGKNATWLNGGYYSNYGVQTRYMRGTALLRVDNGSVHLDSIFSTKAGA